ncbi:MAG TPA: cytochrome c [Rhodopila sp.]|jgi:cytochrome c556|nr:cytochrome c [Rhodopila sp.]
MTKRIALCAVLMLAGLGAARADGLDPIAVRQAGFALQGGDFAFIRAVVAAKGDVKTLADPAAAVAKWTAVIPTLFPKGTETGGNTKALAEIWSDPAGFQKVAAAANAAAVKLASDAKAGDAAAVADDAKALGQQCGGCHKTYRAK